jgi:hypothetical protein
MVRTGIKGAAGWAFGLSLSILLIAMWGRAVVIDTDAMAEALSPLSESTAVVGLFSEWVETELVENGVDAEIATGAVDQVIESSKFAAALEEFVAAVVGGAASADPAGYSVDVAFLLEPAIPEIVEALAVAGIPVGPEEVRTVVADLDPFVVRPPGSRSYVGANSPVAARLGTAAVIALTAMLSFGWMVIASSEDRLVAVRQLLSRVALGALSYAVLLKLGSWVLDPGGGRAPLGRTLSSFAGSKWLVPLGFSAVAGVLAGVVVVVGRMTRRAATNPPLTEPPTPKEEPALSQSRTG